MRLCSFPDCGRPFLSKGLCQSHYVQQCRGEELRPVKGTPGALPVMECVFEGCDRARLTRSGLCGPHRRQEIRGQPLQPIRGERAECAFADCGRKVKNKGLCDAHAQQRKRGAPLRPLHVPTYRYVRSDGYIVLKDPSHPASGKNGRLMEHVKVMTDHLGRPLLPCENVHHINGIRGDNRLENLELWNTRQPKGQRVDQKVEWAVELLRLYRPDLLA